MPRGPQPSPAACVLHFSKASQLPKGESLQGKCAGLETSWRSGEQRWSAWKIDTDVSSSLKRPALPPSLARSSGLHKYQLSDTASVGMASFVAGGCASFVAQSVVVPIDVVRAWCKGGFSFLIMGWSMCMEMSDGRLGDDAERPGRGPGLRQMGV